jgi:autotransporter translocation and assembly factor TamB
VGVAADQVALQVSGNAGLSLLQGFARDVRATGRAQLTASVTGPLRQPRFSGSATITDGRVRHFSLPNAFDAINGTVSFDGQSIRLDELTATLGGGRVQVGGRIGIDGYVPGEINLTAHGEDMQLRLRDGLRSARRRPHGDGPGDGADDRRYGDGEECRLDEASRCSRQHLRPHAIVG